MIAVVAAEKIMSSPVVTVAPQASTAEVAETLRRNRISAVPVVDETGVVLGLVSEYNCSPRPGA